MNCCHIAGSVLAETHFTPALLSADTSAPAQQCAIRMAARNQRANCPATAQKIAATMFTIHAMVGKRRNQINMPRLDAYHGVVIDDAYSNHEIPLRCIWKE